MAKAKTKPKKKKTDASKPPTPKMVEKIKASIASRERDRGIEMLVAGPFALYSYHKHIVKAAAKTRSRYELNSVALVSNVPGLVATDGRALAMLPLQAIDTKTGKLGDFGTAFHKGVDPFLLPLDLFKGLPTKLDAGQTHIELTIVEREALDAEGNPCGTHQQWAVVRHCPYGNTYEYPVYEGTFPEYSALLFSDDEVLHRTKATARIDVTLLTNVAKAIGGGDVTLKVHDGKSAAVLEPAGIGDEVTPTWHGRGIIMPMTLE